MNWDTIKGNWKQYKGMAREKWGDLTDDDVDRIQGEQEQLAGLLQERYGMARDEADRQIREFEKSVSRTAGTR
ncbi:MAG: CsbD family protein [Pirellulales bacterium]